MEESIREELRGGGRVFNLKRRSASLVWCGGGQYAVIPSGRSLRLYLYRTAEDETKRLNRIKTLAGHTDEITAVADVGKFRCVSGSADGTMKLWDVSDGAVIRTVDLGVPIKALATNETCRGRTYVALASEIRRIDMMKGKTEAAIGLDCGMLAMSPKHEMLVSVRRKVVYMFSGNVGFDNGSFVNFTHPRKVCSIAIHPEDGSIAVGDEKGVVTIYHNVLRQCAGHIRGRKKLDVDKVRQSRMHWHASAVLSLSYMVEGVNLLSGGHEGVIVRWDLANGRRRFLPRLGGALLAIAPNPSGTVYAVSCADNSVQFVSMTSFSVEAFVRGLRCPDSYKLESAGDNKISLLPDPLVPGVVLVLGLPSILQLYDLWRDEAIGEILVSPRNDLLTFQSGKNEGSSTKSYVEFASLGRASRDLVTVDVLLGGTRKETTVRTETLKFWTFDENYKKVALRAKIEEPHSKAEIRCVGFHPTQSIVATCASDGSIRFWRKASEGSWQCEQKFGYKNLPCVSTSFSADGSLFAAGCGSAVVVWILDKNGAVNFSVEPKVLSHGLAHSGIQRIAFTGDASSPLLISASSDMLHVWNVITHSVWWSARMSVQSIAVDLVGSRFAVYVDLSEGQSGGGMSRERGIAVFDAASPAPSRVFRSSSNVLSMAFVVTTDLTRSALAVLNDRLEITSIGENDLQRMIQTEARDDDSTNAIIGEDLGGGSTSPESLQFPNVDDTAQDKPAPSENGRDKFGSGIALRRAAALFDAPTHTLPPLTVLADRYFSELLSEPFGVIEATSDEDGEEQSSANVGSTGVTKRTMRSTASATTGMGVRREITGVMSLEELQKLVEHFKEA
mmetsp:Transcript_10838/g.33238  ORF Transcript_10838/g.33238 Transcript_10838/m.33238 type:complete len:844 (+) Transcript_10838:108-2639(+)|eukprot:CAMPEP_0198736412 /NCGR_PEP_ID=MMETSP1475-20131203/65510_1 /TAXON_ID= ORGANISM="Unidentified sp., Strain CCMP1999" /NCGR_SAMPLE_ID=MMETSP1475 /ASSEMBLY_ACC=CAM_ASM_001111 /LENGTH=843 /DNA_ID=CAMNT_0044500217 /DNA_START=20 /DNA_END=2551 /DNA_ORIENTATION=-